MIATVMALILAGGTVQDDGWVTVEGGRKHVATGITCPNSVGNLRLDSTTGTAEKLSCAYEYDCPDGADCGNAIAFASVSFDPAKDIPSQLRALAKQQGLTVGGMPPAWGATPKMYASGGTGEDESHAAWWKAGKADVGAIWNVAAAKDVEALVRAAAAANS